MDEFYSKSKPSLVVPRIEKTVYKIVKKSSNNKTISEQISHKMYELYQTYIQEHKFLAAIIFSAIVFLIYRYYKTKEDKEGNDKEEGFNSDEYNVYKDIKDYQTSHLRYDTQPHFDRLQSVKDQAEPVNYPPDPLPVNIPGSGIIYRRNIYDDPKPYPYLNTPKYDYNNVYNNKSLSYYNGTYNPYYKAQDTTIPNPLGHLNNFNTSTGDFVTQMTNANTQNILDYQTILDNTQGNLIDNLKVGPQYLNVDELEPQIAPPYAM